MSMASMIRSLFGDRGGKIRRTRRCDLGVERLDRRAMLASVSWADFAPPTLPASAWGWNDTVVAPPPERPVAAPVQIIPGGSVCQSEPLSTGVLVKIPAIIPVVTPSSSPPRPYEPPLYGHYDPSFGHSPPAGEGSPWGDARPHVTPPVSSPSKPGETKPWVPDSDPLKDAVKVLEDAWINRITIQRAEAAPAIVDVP